MNEIHATQAPEAEITPRPEPRYGDVAKPARTADEPKHTPTPIPALIEDLEGLVGESKEMLRGLMDSFGEPIAADQGKAVAEFPSLRDRLHDLRSEASALKINLQALWNSIG